MTALLSEFLLSVTLAAATPAPAADPGRGRNGPRRDVQTGLEKGWYVGSLLLMLIGIWRDARRVANWGGTNADHQTRYAHSRRFCGCG